MDSNTHIDICKYIDISSINQVIGVIYKNPKILLQDDKYSFIEFFRVSYDSGEQIVSRLTGILETQPWPDYVPEK